jgi:hypothetical protein
MLSNTLEPTGLDSIEPALPLYELLSTHVDRTIVVSQGYTPTTANKKNTDEKNQEKE